MKLQIFFLSILSLLFSTSVASSQLQFQLLSLDGSPNGLKIDASRFPILRAVAQAAYNNSALQLDEQKIFILENGQQTRPYSVSQNSGAYEIFWISKTTGAPSATVIATHNGKAKGESAGYDPSDMFIAEFWTADNTLQIKEVNFGFVAPGEPYAYTMQLQAKKGKTLELNREKAVRVDSIVSSSPLFAVEWIGGQLNNQPPPVDMLPNFQYYFRITFAPTSIGYVREYLTAYLEGGAKITIPLIGFSANLPSTQIMTLSTPNGGEVFAPCEKAVIKWKGSAIDAETLIEYSANDGRDWSKAGTSPDTSFTWNVPNISSDSVLIRVTQDYSAVGELSLRGVSTGATRAAYSETGTTLLIAHENGQISEWNMLTNQKIFDYILPFSGFPIDRAKAIGLGYTSDTTFFCANSVDGGGQSISFFSVNNPNPLQTIELSASDPLVEVLLDPKKTFLLTVPALGASASLLSTSDASVLQTLVFNDPIASIAFNNSNGAVIAFLSGKISLYSLPNFTESTSFILPELPLILKSAITDDSKLIAVSTKLPAPTLYSPATSNVMIIDVAKKQIVRFLPSPVSSDAVGLRFSRSNRFLAVGLRQVPFISLWNLSPNKFIGGLSGHSTTMTDIQFSPDERSVATTSLGSDNIKIRKIAFPESDQSDRIFSIQPASVSISLSDLKSQFIYSEKDTTITGTLCNNGRSPFIPESSYFDRGVHFSFTDPIDPNTPLLPGKCLAFSLRYVPLDTGIIRDTLNIVFCSKNYRAPFVAFGKNRNLTLSSSGAYLGEICIGDSLDVTLPILTNNDPIPILINTISISNPNFRVLTPIKDTLIQPGQTLSANLRFVPTSVGLLPAIVNILHSSQTVITPTFSISARGLGADVTVLSSLYFLPELLTRTIAYRNNSINPLTITQSTLSLPGRAVISPPLPITISPKDSVVFTITLDSELNLGESITWETSVEPCLTKKTVTLLPYSGLSSIFIPQITADPRFTTSIPINFQNAEPASFGGKRKFSLEFTVDEHIFLPLEISSDYGEASIVKNEFSGGLRTVGIVVNGIFPKSGTAATISGPAGLSTELESAIHILPTSEFWGKSVVMQSLNDGKITLNNICGDPRLAFNNISSLLLSPSPVADLLYLNIEVLEATNATYSIVDYLGKLANPSRSSTLSAGRHSVSFDVSTLPPGAYNLIISHIGGTTSAAFVITR